MDEPIGERDDTNGNLNNHALDVNALNPKDATNGRPNLVYLRDGTKKYTIVNGKYRGFQIFNENQQVAVIASLTTPINDTNGNKHLILNGYAAMADSHISKTKIDNFRTVFYDTTKNEKKYFRGFWLGDNFTSVTPATNDKDATRADYGTGNFNIFADTEVEG